MTPDPEEILWRGFLQTVRKKLSGAPGCHDLSHTMRVLRNAELLIRTEQTEHAFAVRTAALFHDFARPEEMASKGALNHALLGAEMVKAELEKTSCNPEFIRIVTNCIRRHRYRGNDPPQSIEEKILYDADKLDSTGAFGVARAFYFAGGNGAKIDNPGADALAAEPYGKDDTAYREYLVKLRRIPGKMMTESGKKLASERAAFMTEFFRRLKQESGEDL